MERVLDSLFSYIPQILAGLIVGVLVLLVEYKTGWFVELTGHYRRPGFLLSIISSYGKSLIFGFVSAFCLVIIIDVIADMNSGGGEIMMARLQNLFLVLSVLLIIVPPSLFAFGSVQGLRERGWFGRVPSPLRFFWALVAALCTWAWLTHWFGVDPLTADWRDSINQIVLYGQNLDRSRWQQTNYILLFASSALTAIAPTLAARGADILSGIAVILPIVVIGAFILYQVGNWVVHNWALAIGLVLLVLIITGGIALAISEYEKNNAGGPQPDQGNDTGKNKS